MPLYYCYIKMDNMDNFYSSLKLAKFGLGVKATCFVSFLAWTGVILSIVGLLFSFLQIISLVTYGFSHQAYTGEFLGAFLFFFSSSWLVLHLVLRKKNVQGDLHSIKRILKIKCFIIGGIEIILSIVGIVDVIVLLAYHGNVMEMKFGLILTGFFYLLLFGFSCSMIHGVRKDINNYLKASIFFKIFYALVFILLSVSEANALTSGISSVLFLFAYSYGGVIVLYNINYHSTSNIYSSKDLAFKDENKQIQA